MLSDEDHPGLFMFLIGLIVVVMTAVGLASLANVKFSVAHSSQSHSKELEDGAAELEQLTADHGKLARRLAQAEARAQAAQASQAARRSELAAQAQRLTALTARCTELQQTIPSTQEAFRRYRADYREQVWDQAVGEALDTLTLRDGREYRQAVIKRVTPVGLEINHEGGLARIQAPDLDPALQERFQWNAEERRSFMKENQAQRPSPSVDLPKMVPPPTVKPAVPTPPPPAPAAPALAADLKQLRSAVVVASSKVARLNTQLSDARAAAAAGQTAVPGSLETWRSRIANLEASLTRANNALTIAKANLAAAAPAAPPAP